MTNINPIITTLQFPIDLLTQLFPAYKSRRQSHTKSVMSDTCNKFSLTARGDSGASK